MFYLKIWPNAWVPKFNPGSTQVSLAGAQILATTTTTTTTTPSSSSRDRQKFHDLYFQTLSIWCGGLNQLPLSVFRPRNATKCTSLLQQTKRNSLMHWLYLYVTNQLFVRLVKQRTTMATNNRCLKLAASFFKTPFRLKCITPKHLKGQLEPPVSDEKVFVCCLSVCL